MLVRSWGSNLSCLHSVNIQALTTTDIKGLIEQHDSQTTIGAHSSGGNSVNNPSLKMTISVNKSKAKMKKKKDKKKKKKHHRKYDSDDEEDEDDSPSDFSDEDSDDDYE